jgi:hypothetical protein
VPNMTVKDPGIHPTSSSNSLPMVGIQHCQSQQRHSQEGVGSAKHDSKTPHKLQQCASCICVSIFCHPTMSCTLQLLV